MKSEEPKMYRWYVKDNQQTCHNCIIDLVPGYYPDAESAKKGYERHYGVLVFREHLFGVQPIMESEVPYWYYKDNKLV